MAKYSFIWTIANMLDNVQSVDHYSKINPDMKTLLGIVCNRNMLYLHDLAEIVNVS